MSKAVTEMDARSAALSGKPIEIYGLKLWGIQMRQYAEWAKCKNVWLARQSTFPVFCISMTFLDALLALDMKALDETGRPAGNINRILYGLALAMRFDAECLTDQDITISMDADTRKLKAIVIKRKDEDGYTEITPSQFNTLRQIVAWMQGDKTPDESMNDELLETAADLAERNAPALNYDLLDMEASVGLAYGKRIQDVMNWTILEFETSRRAIDRSRKYLICGIGATNGCKWEGGKQAMMLLNNPYLYLKGTCEVTVKRPSDGQIVFQSSKVTTNNFTSSVDMGEIRAGLGNPIAIQLPSNAAVNLELTTADFSMQARAMQVGTENAYNAIVPVCASVTASGATLSLPEGAAPVAFYGDAEAYAYVNFVGADDPGKAYLISDEGEIEGFAAVSGTTYNVIYYENRADAQYFAISSMIAPGVYSVYAKMAVFSTEGTNANNRGSQVGWASYVIPRMQFGGDVATNGSQTDPATTTLSGTALSYEQAVEAGACVDCNFPNLAYMIYEPLTFNGNNAIVGMAVVGGNLEVTTANTKVVPVKYIMANGTVVQPKFSDLTFTMADTSVATVANGVVTGVAVGNTSMTIAGPAGSNVDPITVGVDVVLR